MTSRRKGWAGILVFLVLWGGQEVRAQDTPLEGALPDSIVVTASRQEEDVRRTGRRVTVWTAQEIAAQPVSSVDELLRFIGGVEVQSRGGFGIQSDITMRGSSFNGVLVLIDGARINDPMTGHFLSDLPVPLSEVARVEVVRGPATAIYGPDALGGVIQIFTYAGLESLEVQSTVGGTAALRMGRHELYDVDLAIRGVKNRSGLSAATAWQGTDGMPIRSQNGMNMQSTWGDVRTDFTRRAHTAAFVRAFDTMRLYTRAGMDSRRFGAYRFYSPSASDTAREATSTYWAQVRLASTAPSALRWEGSIAAKQHEDEYVFNPQTPANVHTSRMLSGHFQLSRPLGRILSVTGGTSAEVRGIDSNNLGVHQDVSGGGFLFLRWQPAPRLTINSSGRIDYDPVYGVEATPQVSAAYNVSSVTLRAVAGRAVRAPNYVERYINTTLARPRGRSLGNPDLKAETAWAYEAGVDLYPASGLSLHTTVFTRRTRNLIDYAMLTPQDTVFLARNIHTVRTNGLEVDADYSRDIGDTRVQLKTSYTRLAADLGDVPEGTSYQYVLTHARHLVQAGVALRRGALSAGLNGQWKDRLEGTSYGLVNLRLGYALYFGRQPLMLTGEVRNLFDTEYMEVFDAPMPGRWWLLGLRFTR